MTDLRSLDKSEFFDVYRQFFPHATREQYEAEWEKFQAAKTEHERRKAIQGGKVKALGLFVGILAAMCCCLSLMAAMFYAGCILVDSPRTGVGIILGVVAIISLALTLFVRDRVA